MQTWNYKNKFGILKKCFAQKTLHRAPLSLNRNVKFFFPLLGYGDKEQSNGKDAFFLPLRDMYKLCVYGTRDLYKVTDSFNVLVCLAFREPNSFKLYYDVDLLGGLLPDMTAITLLLGRQLSWKKTTPYYINLMIFIRNFLEITSDISLLLLRGSPAR